MSPDDGARRLGFGFHVITVFPEMINGALAYGVVSQAMKTGKITLTATTPRTFTSNVHQTVDDRPFGGGDGMIMMAEPMSQALEHVKAKIADSRRSQVIHLSPRGRPLTDELARSLAHDFDDLILIASRYGGLDQRFLNTCVDEEISVGDYVLSGGELPALVLIDAVARLLPGVLGNAESGASESFAHASHGGLEFPQFTRPAEWSGQGIPEVLMSGNHARIVAWKQAMTVIVTAQNRPELLLGFTPKALEGAQLWLSKADSQELELCGIRIEGRESVASAIRTAIQVVLAEKG